MRLLTLILLMILSGGLKAQSDTSIHIIAVPGQPGGFPNLPTNEGPVLLCPPCFLTTADVAGRVVKPGDYISSIDWIVMLDSTGHLVMDRNVFMIVRLNNGTWINSGFVATDQEPSSQLGMPIHWYFCKRKESQSIIVNPKP